MSEIHKQLKETLLQFRQLQKVRQHHEALQQRLSEEVKALGEVQKALKKEEKDVEKLEKTSVRSLFHKMLGDREKQIENERQQYLQVALRYNELSKSIDLIQYELHILEKKLLDFDRLKLEYRNLMILREKELMQDDPDIGPELILLHKQIDRGHILKKDIQEAIRAGREAERILLAMDKELQAARNWGYHDTAGGRGASSYMKHRSIDRAKDLSYRARHALLLFRRELEEIFEDARIRININMDGFNSFTDIFFDNLISDWIIQQRIGRAMRDVRQVRHQVKTTLQQLAREKPRLEKEMLALEKKRESMILESEKL
jgi:hypothetical protein